VTSLHIDWHCVCGDGPASHYTTEKGEQCYGWCQQTDKDCAGQGYRPIEHAYYPYAWTPMIEAIGTDSERWPKHYTIDLSSDYQVVRDLDESDEFIWVVREMGTHLYPLKYLPTDVHGFIRQALQYHERNHEVAHVFHWTGETLERIDWSKARSLVRAGAPVPA